MNAGDTGVGMVKLKGAVGYTFSANNEAGLSVDDLSTAADTINLGGANQTVTGGGAGKLTINGSSAGHDTIIEKANMLNGDSIGNFMAAGDVIDVTNLTFAKLKSATFTENAAGTAGVLSVSDGAHSASVTFFGQFLAANSSGSAASAGFHFASNGIAGTNITWIATPH
jgi:hypothetical protein